MSEPDFTGEICESINKVKEWLISRPSPEVEDADIGVIRPSEGLKAIGFEALKLEKFEIVHNDRFVLCQDFDKQKAQNWTKLSHLVLWTTKFLDSLRAHKSQLAALELLRGNKEVSISLAMFHVTEAINIVQSALNFDAALDMQHPDTQGQNFAVENVIVEDLTAVHDIVRQVFMCLFSRCVVRLVVKVNNYCSAALAAYLFDLMIQSGANESEVKVLSFNKRDSVGNERLSKCVHSSKSSKLSTVAIVFARTDPFAAAQGILESYFREQYPNLIILVEEAAYEPFIKDWQRYYSHAIIIGSRLDPLTIVTNELNTKVKIDLTAIDIKAAHKMTGNSINFIRFRNLTDLISLLNNFRKVPIMSLWHDDSLLLRDLCNDINCCSQFWLRHFPVSHHGRKFASDMIEHFADYFSSAVTNTYNNMSVHFNTEIELLRKQQAAFLKKDPKLRVQLVMHAYLSTVAKYKSLKNGASVTEAVVKLRRFHQSLHRLQDLNAGDSRIETLLKPLGLALVNVSATKCEDGDAGSPSNGITSHRFKAILTDFIFKNLLLGNAVLVCCPPNTLGAKFALENDHIIPFKMVHDAEGLPDISKLSLETSVSIADAALSIKKQCPKNTYAIEFSSQLTSEAIDAIILALGTKHKSFWYPDAVQTNYWTDV